MVVNHPSFKCLRKVHGVSAQWITGGNFSCHENGYWLHIIQFLLTARCLLDVVANPSLLFQACFPYSHRLPSRSRQRSFFSALLSSLPPLPSSSPSFSASVSFSTLSSSFPTATHSLQSSQTPLPSSSKLSNFSNGPGHRAPLRQAS
jgi:hypothetical protein